MYPGVPVAAIEVDEHGMIRSASPPARVLLGFDGDAMPALLDDVLANAEHVMSEVRAGRTWSNEFCALKHDGNEQIVAVRALPVDNEPDESGALVMMYPRDGSWLHAFEAFFAHSDDLFSITTQDGYFTRLNPAWQRTLGYGLDELMASRHLDLVHPDDHDRTLDRARRVRAGQSMAAFENRYRHKDGSYVWLQWTICAPPAGDIFAVGRDVTAHKQAIDELRTAHEKLKEDAARHSTMFLQAIHDLGGALSPIRFRLEQLRRAHDDPVFDRLVTMGGHMASLIDQLRDLGSVEGGHMKLDLHTQSVPRLVEPIIDAHQALAEHHGLTFVSEMSDDLVEADAFRLTQVVYNLLGNAMRFTKAPGQVMVSSGPDDNGVLIEVRDTGRGLTRDEIDRLFQPFSQVHEPGEVAERGSGLGLVIARQIVTLHHGRIWAESAGHGRGSSFKVWLPRKQPPMATGAAP